MCCTIRLIEEESITKDFEWGHSLTWSSVLVSHSDVIGCAGVTAWCDWLCWCHSLMWFAVLWPLTWDVPPGEQVPRSPGNSDPVEGSAAVCGVQRCEAVHFRQVHWNTINTSLKCLRKTVQTHWSTNHLASQITTHYLIKIIGSAPGLAQTDPLNHTE
jgi:hypothetical protein